MRFRPVSTTNERGTTLVEVVSSMLVASSAILGLGAIYLFGLDAQEKASARVRLHETATLALEQVEQALENAADVSLTNNQLVVTLNTFDTSKTQDIIFRLSGGRLYRNDTLIVPLYTNPLYQEISIRRWRLDLTPGVEMTLGWKCSVHPNEPEEILTVRTQAYSRNSSLESSSSSSPFHDL